MGAESGCLESEATSSEMWEAEDARTRMRSSMSKSNLCLIA
jgi:hypothetical protein